MDYKTVKEYADWYRGFLRQMKRDGIELDDMPPDVLESCLAMHQNALLVWMCEHQLEKK